MKAERRPEAPHDHSITLTDDPPSITDRPVSLREGRSRRAICREAERLMPLTRYYGPRPLLAIPLGEIYVRGRWAA
jgi:hypothetical protein